MSLHQLEEAILAEAKSEAATISARFQASITQEEHRLAQLAARVEESVVADAHTRGAVEARRLAQASRLNARADILRAKQAELDQLQTAFIAQILEWPATKTKPLLQSLLALLPAEAGQLVVGDKHEAALRPLVKSRMLTIDTHTLSDEGGFIYRGVASEINLTISKLVGTLFETHRAELAHALFG